jgi:hypothetical protein
MNKFLKVTNDGRLYISDEDFFKQPAVLSVIQRLLDSSIYKDIENKKNFPKKTKVKTPKPS